MKKALIFAVCFGCLLVCAANAAEKNKKWPFENETKQERDARMAWFREAKFGMFIHWGVYSVPAGGWKDRTDGTEWIQEQFKIPMSQYEKFRDQFNPVKFDAKKWVELAKNAGMKYMVITSKHHDGFTMFHSQLTDWGIKSTPFKRDPMKELSEECQKAGIKFCFYHSIMDWHHPDYMPRRPWNDVAKGEPNFDRYVEYMKGQVKELLTNYGPIGIMWFDGEWEDTWTQERGHDLYNYCRSLQPSVLVNNRVGKNRQGSMEGISKGEDQVGDFGTPEQTIPPNGLPGVDWEACMTINYHWGYSKYDHSWKSTKELLQKLIDIASKGGNFLLNVGPTSEGVIPEPSVQRLTEMGQWLKVNGEAIYGTTANPFPTAPAWGRVTQKPGKLFFHVFDWPKDGKLVVDVDPKTVTAVYILSDPQYSPLNTSTKDGKLEIAVPEKAPDPIATVVVVETAQQ